MKQKQQKQYAGVWLDNQHAMIIANEGNEDYSVLNRVKATENQRSGSEHAMNNGKQTEHLKYFKALSSLLMPYDEILLFGPGQSQEQFQHHLKEDSQFNSKQISIDSSGQLTDPQMIAKVRDFFKGRQS
jgi:stalled ribosome rescue protein Dom34